MRSLQANGLLMASYGQRSNEQSIVELHGGVALLALKEEVVEGIA